MNGERGKAVGMACARLCVTVCSVGASERCLIILLVVMTVDAPS
jgi:hypothetical protein